MSADTNPENILDITIDTVDGPVRKRLELDSLSLEEVAELVILVPSIKSYYGSRLVKELKGPPSTDNVAKETKYADAEPVSIYFYVDRVTGIVDAIFMFSITAMAIRRFNTWDTITREEPEFRIYINSNDWDVWKLDWSKGGGGEVVDLDPADESAWDPALIQAWDKGGPIDTNLLDIYAFKTDLIIENPGQQK